MIRELEKIAMDKSSLLEVLKPSGWDLVKVLLTAVVILLVTKVQLVSDKLSALLIALPLTSVVAMLWMYHDGRGGDMSGRVKGIGDHAFYTFWYVLPTLPMFLILPWALKKGIGFYPGLFLNLIGTVGLFFGFSYLVKRWFGIELMP